MPVVVLPVPGLPIGHSPDPAARMRSNPNLVYMASRVALHEITIDCQSVDRVAGFWAALFETELREPLPGWRLFGPLVPNGPILNFQPVPEPKVDKTRIHLDLQTDDLAATVKAVEQLGGSDLGIRHEYDEGTVAVMADPEGNEFCLVHYT